MQKWVHTPALKDSDHKRRNERCRLQNADQRVTDVAPVLSCRSLNGTPCMDSKCMSKSPSFHDRPTKAGLECIVGQHTSGRCIPLATWHRAIRRDGAFSLIGFGSDPQAAAQDHHLCLDLQQLTEQCSRKALSQISVHRQIF